MISIPNINNTIKVSKRVKPVENRRFRLDIAEKAYDRCFVACISIDKIPLMTRKSEKSPLPLPC
jgi:hypothetical protein